MKYKVIGFILIFIIIGGIALYFQRLNYYKRIGNGNPLPTPSVVVSPNISGSPTPTLSGTPEPTPTSSASPSVSPRPEKTLKIEVTEIAAGLYESRAKKGTVVHFTISVMSESRTLEFKSGGITTGSISPGSSKTIEFTLEQDMTFTPYEMPSGTVAPYTIKIIATE